MTGIGYFNGDGRSDILYQDAAGYEATIVSGQVLLRDNEPTDNLSGKLVRRGARH